MSNLLTMFRPGGAVPVPRLPAGYRFRPCDRADIDRLGRLYFESYDPGVACADVAEATADMHAAFNGDYGELWPEASQVATTPEDDIVAAIQVVRRALWPDVPSCPFVIELFTARTHRRRNLARSLVIGALAVIARVERPDLALRVSADNRSAFDLYRDLGFQDWRTVATEDRRNAQ